MMIVSASKFYVYLTPGVNARLALCLNSVLNVKALVGTFNQEKAQIWVVFSMIVKSSPKVHLLLYLCAITERCPGWDGEGRLYDIESEQLLPMLCCVWLRRARVVVLLVRVSS